PRRHEHSLPHGEAINMRADLLHKPGRIRPRHMRKRHGIGGIALSYPDVEVIQRTGLNANPHILRTDRRLGQILIRKHLRSTMLAKQYRFHQAPTSQARRSLELMIKELLLIFAGCSKRTSSKAAGESKPEAYPQGYVEDFDEPRTPLADVFSILLKTQRPFDDHDHLPAHFHRLDRIVIRFHLDQNARRTSDFIALLDDDFRQWPHFNEPIVDEIGTHSPAGTPSRGI